MPRLSPKKALSVGEKSASGVRMKALYETRGFIVAVEVFYLLVLFALALIYLTDLGSAYHLSLPTSLGPLPVGVPWSELESLAFDAAVDRHQSCDHLVAHVSGRDSGGRLDRQRAGRELD
jgi:hypothetical protein